jgi:hypothetical protein
VFVTCFNRFEGVGEEMTRGCVLRETSGVDYTERRKTEREEITLPAHQRELFLEKF